MYKNYNLKFQMSSKSSNSMRFILVFFSFILAVIFQILITNEKYIWSITPLCISFVAMFFAVRSAKNFIFQKNVSTSYKNSEFIFKWNNMRIIFLIFSFTMCIIACLLFRNNDYNAFALLFFIFSIISFYSLFVIEKLKLIINYENLNIKNINISFIWVLLFFILILAFILRIYNINKLPKGLWYEEAVIIWEAKSLIGNLNQISEYSQSINISNLYLLPTTFLIELFGVSVSVGRIQSIFISLLSIIFMFLFVRLIFGNRIALISSLLIATMRWELIWSRMSLPIIVLPLLLLLASWMLFRTLKNNKPLDYAGLGGVLGLGVWFNFSFCIFSIVIFLYLFTYSRQFLDFNWYKYLQKIMFIVLGVLIISAPSILSMFMNGQGVLINTTNDYIFNNFDIDEFIYQIIRNFSEYLAMFNYLGDSNPRHNVVGFPMLDFISGVFLIMGLSVCLANYKDLRFRFLLIWLFFMLLPGILSISWNTPDSMKTIGVIPPVIIIITLGINTFWIFSSIVPWKFIRSKINYLFGFIVILIIFLNIYFYFYTYSTDDKVYSAFSTDHTLIAQDIINKRQDGFDIRGSRHFYGSLTLNVLTDNDDFLVILPEELPISPNLIEQGVAIYLEPRDKGMYDLLKLYYPNGQYSIITSPNEEILLYYLAVLNKDDLTLSNGLNAKYIYSNKEEVYETLLFSQQNWNIEKYSSKVPESYVWEGAIYINEPGLYKFYLESKDDVQMYFDGRPILSKNKKSIDLYPAVGIHKILIEGDNIDYNYFTALYWKPPGKGFELIGNNNLYKEPIQPYGFLASFFSIEPNVVINNDDYNSYIINSSEPFWYESKLEEPNTSLFEAYINIPTDDNYIFKIDSQSEVIINLNFNTLQEKASSYSSVEYEPVYLNKGENRIQIEFKNLFNLNSSMMKILWSKNNSIFEPIPVNLLSPIPDKMFKVKP